MQRSSETIGLIAGALAKAQIELANPERSLTRDHPLSLPNGVIIVQFNAFLRCSPHGIPQGGC